MVVLTEEQIKKFEDEGFLLIPDYCDGAVCDQLKDCVDTVVEEQLDLASHPKCVFTTYQASDAQPDAHMMTNYFLNSGDNISFFFEDGAFDDKGKLVLPKTKALNKVGHALHTDVPLYKNFTQSNEMKAICKQLSFAHPVLFQSMLIFKSPKLGGEVTPHKDSTFLHTGGTKLVGFWMPLDDVTTENGCLWFIPGSHKEKSTLKMNRKPDNTGCEFAGEKNKEFDDDAAYVKAEVAKGSLVLIHGEVTHKSGKNESDKSRNAYAWHVYEGEGSDWQLTNWLQPTEKGTFVTLY